MLRDRSCNPSDQGRVTRPMEKVKTGLRGLSAVAKAQRASIVYTHMNGNPHFPSPTPSMAEFHAAYIELKSANLAALDRGRMAMARRDRAVEVMDSCLTRLAAYVNSTCLGDSIKLASSGFLLVKRPEPISTLKRPTGMKVRPTAYPGQVRISWNPVPGARMYELERSETGAINGPWEHVVTISRPYLVTDGIASNTLQLFRVRAIGTRTESPYADAFGKAA